MTPPPSETADRVSGPGGHDGVMLGDLVQKARAQGGAAASACSATMSACCALLNAKTCPQ